MPKQRSNLMSCLTMILAVAAFINSLLPNSPIALGAPKRQAATNATAQPAQPAQPIVAAQADQAAISLQGAAVASTVPPYIGYQGVLRDNEGKPITGQVNVTFRIYDALTGDFTQCRQDLSPCKWEEKHNNITVRDGRFSVLLGNASPVGNPITPTLMTSPDRFIGVQVDGYQEMLPRQRFSSVPFAMWSEQAAALSAPDGAPLNAVYVNNAGLVGIGTTNPQSSLQVMDGALGGIAIGDGTLVDSPNLRFVGNQNHWNFDNYNGDLRLFTETGFGGVGGILRAEFGANGNVIIPGNLGVGTANPQARLHVAGDSKVDGSLTFGGNLQMGGIDFVMSEVPGRGGGRAMVNWENDVLILNFGRDFANGVGIGGPVVGIDGDLHVGGSLRLSGQKLCSVVASNNWRDTILVSHGWTLDTCRRFRDSVGATQYQAACLFNDDFSWGGVNGGPPDRNCGWQ